MRKCHIQTINAGEHGNSSFISLKKCRKSYWLSHKSFSIHNLWSVRIFKCLFATKNHVEYRQFCFVSVYFFSCYSVHSTKAKPHLLFLSVCLLLRKFRNENYEQNNLVCGFITLQDIYSIYRYVFFLNSIRFDMSKSCNVKITSHPCWFCGKWPFRMNGYCLWLHIEWNLRRLVICFGIGQIKLYTLAYFQLVIWWDFICSSQKQFRLAREYGVSNEQNYNTLYKTD